MTWHLDIETVNRYQLGRVDHRVAASVEAHLQACQECQRQVVSESGWLEQNWSGIASIIEPPTPNFFERVLRGFGVPQHLARVIAITPSLRPAWLLAITLMLGFAGFASQANRSTTQFDLFLAVAPVVPVLGVALAYGRLGDPAYEMTVSSPMDSLRLLLMRSAVVTGVAIVLASVVDVANGALGGVGAWLIPTLALTAAALALGTRMRLWLACVSAIASWVLLLSFVASRSQGSIDPAFEAVPQLIFSLVTLVALVVVKEAGDRYRRGEK